MSIKKVEINLYNTLTHGLEKFKSVADEKITMYSCGPTLHKLHTQIGNLRSYVFSDMLKRYFLYLGYEVEHVIKITDVDDHIVAECNSSGRDLTEYTTENYNDFLKQLKKINLLKPSYLPRVTENIDSLVKAIQELDGKGFVYYSKGSAYFKIDKVEKYGELVNIEKQKSLKKNAQGRLRSFIEEAKQNNNDFCLWKAWTKKDGEIFWETAIGKGRPGWHLECSVLALKLLGDTVDVHIGGISHIFPHHTNEIAISESLTDKKFVNYWLHHDYLIVDGVAMSKEKGTFYVLQDVLDKGYHPLVLRYVLMKTHYRQALNFSWSSMEEAKTLINKIVQFYHFLTQEELFSDGVSVDNFKLVISNYESKFNKALSNDLNFSDAMAVVFNFINEVNSNKNNLNIKEADLCRDLLRSFDEVFGFVVTIYKEYKEILEKIITSNDVEAILKERVLAKKDKNYELADEIRNKIEKLGLKIVDFTDDKVYLELNNFWNQNYEK